MKDHKRTRLIARQHANDVARIGNLLTCPLEGSSGSDFLSWLKLQNRKFSYRLLYCDLMTCLSYIIFIFSALHFQTIALPNKWFFALIMLVLIAWCILFIGIHLIQRKESDLKPQAKSAVIDWNSYRNFIRSWNDMFSLNLAAIVIIGIIYGFINPISSVVTSSFYMLITGSLFFFGITFLIRTIRAKEITQLYIFKANRLMKTAA
ncbi:MAG: hypothetical protein JKY70_10815 [Mucilaginibacter sp.]|nr:hypothetical protein [Mucilaginibacter sp.]